MNKKSNPVQHEVADKPLVALKRNPGRQFRALIFGSALGAILLAGYWALAQTAPIMAIAHSGTNQISITITNAILTDSYEVWWTPVLNNTTEYPWTAAAVGSIGQTNFLLANFEYPAVFFSGRLDTNNPPLWENANPNNPGTNILKITIASPANGANLN